VTTLTTWREDDPATEVFRSGDAAEIGAQLASIGVSFERHEPVALGPTATQEDVLTANAALVDALIAKEGFKVVDVAQLHPSDDAEWVVIAAGARAKFLNEHTHDDDEIRFFVDGSGVFYLHLDGHVHALLCTAGDLLNVPADTTHWFDMGDRPDFTAIRFFHIDDGWVGNFTGSQISSLFPDFHTLTAASLAASGE
jgi:1,2-dihydroxy-3-keto-5-methylthiopentene dioxygenase